MLNMNDKTIVFYEPLGHSIHGIIDRKESYWKGTPKRD